MTLQPKEVKTEVFDDFAPREPGELGVNEIIPLISQDRLGPKPVTDRKMERM